MSARVPACPDCRRLKASAAILRGDLGDARGKLVRALGRHDPDQNAIDRYRQTILDFEERLHATEIDLAAHQADGHADTQPERLADLEPAAEQRGGDEEPAVHVIAWRPPDWTRDALCAQIDPEMFFPEKGGSSRQARQVCGSCPVRTDCLDAALANNERFGIWGGLTERNRRHLDKQGEHTA